MQRTPSSKKRRAEEDLEVSAATNLKHDLLELRKIVAAADPLSLQQYILSKFDEASGVEKQQSKPNSVLSTSPVVSTSMPGPMPSLTQSPTTSRKASTSQTSRSGTTPGEPVSSSSLTHVTINPAAINALSTVFSDFSQFKVSSSPSVTTASSRAAPSTSHHTPTSSIHSVIQSGSARRDLTISSGVVPSTPPSSVPGTTRTSATLEKLQQGRERLEEGEELHCVRCHADFFPATNRQGTCLIDHNTEAYERVSEEGKVPSLWEYNCCGYQFKSLEPNSPKDPAADLDKGMYCFVGKHTTDEGEAGARKMNTFSCDDAGCWEEGYGSS